MSNCSHDAQCSHTLYSERPSKSRQTYSQKEHHHSYTHLPCIHTCFQVHPQPRFLGSGVNNLPLLRCAADACVHGGHGQAPGLWAASSGPRAPTQSWTRGNIVSHFPATAASSAPERCLRPYLTSLQSTKRGEKRETVCEINM